MLFVSLFLTATQQRFALPELPQASHSSRSPHRLFKIVSPKPPQALSRGYEWAGFLKSDLGCGLIDLVVGCCGLLGVKSFSGVPWLIDSMIDYGFVVGDDIEWMVDVDCGGQEGRGGGWVFLLGEERDTERERKRCL